METCHKRRSHGAEVRGKSSSYSGAKGLRWERPSVFEEQKEGKHGWSTVSMLEGVGATISSEVANVRSIRPCRQKFGVYSEW